MEQGERKRSISMTQQFVRGAPSIHQSQNNQPLPQPQTLWLPCVRPYVSKPVNLHTHTHSHTLQEHEHFVPLPLHPLFHMGCFFPESSSLAYLRLLPSRNSFPSFFWSSHYHSATLLKSQKVNHKPEDS